MLAVVDTNVFVSRYLSPTGTCALVFRYLDLGRFHLAVAQSILDEYERVLRSPKIASRHNLSEEQIVRATRFVRRRSLYIADLPDQLKVIDVDPKDDKFVECAVAGGADMIVSGDRHLLELGSYEGIRIVSPAVFVTFLELESPEG